jgi:hypothetical protein
MQRNQPPLISDRSPTYVRAQRTWPDGFDETEGQTIGTLSRLVELERDMIAALLAVRHRLADGERAEVDRAQIDQLLVEHADRLPVLERQIRELGGLPPDPGERPGDLPRDAADIAYLSCERDALRALADDHEALADFYRAALAEPHHTAEARRILELYASEMEQHGARLAALLAV